MAEMRLGIGSYTVPWAIGVGPEVPESPMDHLGLIQLGASLGADVVQFADNLPVHNLDGATLDKLRAEADQRDIALEIGVRGVDAAELIRAVEAAVRLGSPFVRTILEGSGGGAIEVPAAIEALSAIEDEYRSRGVLLAIENYERHSIHELTAIVRALDGWVGVCLDTVNSFGALEDPDRVVARLAPETIAVHVKDFTIERQWHRMGFDLVGAPVGEGRLDLAALLRAVGERPFSAVVELWTPFQGDLTSTIALEREWAARSMASLRLAVEGVESDTIGERERTTAWEPN